jgi:hypothetical protein
MRSTILSIKISMFLRILITIWVLGVNVKNKMCNFYNIWARSGIISRMVYMDSGFVGFCIRNAIGGARDEVWQDATF